MARMWKEVPDDDKEKFKQEAAQLQKTFKEQFPEYTYRESKRKRRRAVRTGVIPPPNSIFPAATWQVPWDQLAPFGRANKK
jgi:uncharacterized circularly permuted ATP-grasp superfamily protein